MKKNDKKPKKKPSLEIEIEIGKRMPVGKKKKKDPKKNNPKSY